MKFCLYRKHCACFLTWMFYREGLLAPRSTPKLEYHPLSAVHDCLFNLFAATLHIGGRSSIRNLRTRHAVVTGTHYTDIYIYHPRCGAFTWGSDGVTGSFNWHNPSACTMTWRPNVSCELSDQCLGVYKLTSFLCRLSWNLGASICWNPQGLSRVFVTFIIHLLYKT